MAGDHAGGDRVSALTSAMLPAPPAVMRQCSFSHDRGVVSSDLMNSKRVICSVDADCFYAQCEELRRPELRGQPVGVVQKSLVITSNYPARAFGIKKGDSISVVRRKCPGIELCCGEDLSFYTDVSARIAEVAVSFSARVERLGLDEVFVDITDAVAQRLSSRGSDSAVAPPRGSDSLVGVDYSSEAAEEEGAPGAPASEAEVDCRRRLAVGSQLCAELRQRVREEVGVTTSAGVSVSRLLAKMVASHRKPNQQTIFVPTAPALRRLIPDDLPVSRIPGIGSAARRRWADLEVHSVAQLVHAAQRPQSAAAVAAFGAAQVSSMAQLCEGRCSEAVKKSGPPMLIGAEESFWSNPLRVDGTKQALQMLARKLLRKLRGDERRNGFRPPTHFQVSYRKRGNNQRREGRHTKQTEVQASSCGLRPAGSASDTSADEVATAAIADRAGSLFAKCELEQDDVLHILGIALRLAPPANQKSDLSNFVAAARAAPERVVADAQRAGTKPTMSEYVATSRLSFLGQWRSRFRRFAEPLLSNPPKDADLEAKLAALPHSEMEEWIMHADVDAFFLSVYASSSGDSSVLTRHSAVCSGRGQTSEVCSASYSARQEGVKAGMFVGEALKICPALEVIVVTPGFFSSCAAASADLYKAVIQVSRDVMPLSCDEVMLRITGRAPIDGVAQALREHLAGCGINVSCGIAKSCTMARLATRWAKPPGGGVCVVHPGEEDEKLQSLPLRLISGIGRRTAERVAEVLGVTTCGELHRVRVEKVQGEFGKVLGKQICDLSRGLDSRPPVFGLGAFVRAVPKSLQSECNFRVRPSTSADALGIIADIAGQVAQRAVEEGVVSGKVTLKLLRRRPGVPEPRKDGGHGIVDSWSRSTPLSKPTADSSAVVHCCETLWRKWPYKPDEVRGVGVALTALSSSRPQPAKRQRTLGVPQPAQAFEISDDSLDEDDSAPDLFPDADSQSADVECTTIRPRQPPAAIIIDSSQASDAKRSPSLYVDTDDSSGGVEILDSAPSRPTHTRKRKRGDRAKKVPTAQRLLSEFT
eukprot:Hpha_TRINITY_DN29703_c0_g1::TRINITY_DN29703_c0_g1_i1::g.2716::m.2716/K03510/POLI; DNA polymerase iota